MEKKKLTNNAGAPVADNNNVLTAGKRGGMMRLFMTHPPLEERIARLEASVTQG